MIVSCDNRSCIVFYSRHHAITRICYGNSVCLSVRLSVTRVHCIKVAEHIIQILSLADRPIILVFRQEGWLRKSEDVTPNGGAQHMGRVTIFDQYAAISEELLDKGIFTIEDEYKVVCAVSNSAAFDDLE